MVPAVSVGCTGQPALCPSKVTPSWKPRARRKTLENSKASWSGVSIAVSFEGWHKRPVEQERLGGCNRLLCGSTEREGDVGHVFSLPAKQKDPQCPPGIGNEVGCGVFHLESVFLASAFNRRKPDVLRYARHMEKSCVCMDTHRHAHFLCDTQQVIAAKILTGKHLSLHRQG